MNKVLLFDLDDTLLVNNIEQFIPVYFHKFAEFMADTVPPEAWIRALKNSIEVFQKNLDPRFTLQEVFDKDFFPQLDVEPEILRAKTDQFYTQVFPNLEKFTQTKPEVPGLINSLAQAGHQIILATNPLFPKKAIIHRLKWAGFSDDLSIFEYIPSYETFHFGKPHPEFFAELLGVIGWPQSITVMIGNDIQNDINPAQLMNLHVYHVNPDAIIDSSIPSGPISDLPFFIEKIQNTQFDEPLDPRAILAILRSTPAAISTLLQSIDANTMSDHPLSDEWGLTEIFCHLRDVDRDVNIPRIEKVLHDEKPYLTGIDTDKWAEERNYHLQDGELAFQDFINNRIRMIESIQNLTDIEWRSQAQHTILGPTDLREILEIITQHDRLHIRQIIKTIEIIKKNQRAF